MHEEARQQNTIAAKPEQNKIGRRPVAQTNAIPKLPVASHQNSVKVSYINIL